MKQKSDVATIFPNFHNMIKTQFGKIKRLGTNNWREFFNHISSGMNSSWALIHWYTLTKQSDQKKHGHLLETTDALLFQRQVSKYFWEEVILIATHLINQLPTKVLDFRSPWEVLSHHFLDFFTRNMLPPWVFGCVVFVHIHAYNRSKFDPRVLKCMFVGYSLTQKGYKYYYPPTWKTYIYVDVTFVE